MEISIGIIIFILTSTGLFFQIVPFMRKFKKYGKPSTSIKEKKYKHYDDIKILSERLEEETWNLYEDGFFITIGAFLQLLALLFSILL